MDERARMLARKPAVEPAGDLLEVLTFRLGRESYGIETKYTREVVRLADLTPIPGAPAFVAGLTNYRGQVLCVVDLRILLAARVGSLSDLSRLIVLGIDTIEFGVLADQVDDISHLALGDVTAPSGAGIGAGAEYLIGITPQALTIVNGESLLRASTLFVDHGETTTA
jgi:purine-binding chemotaxis protein CheW